MLTTPCEKLARIIAKAGECRAEALPSDEIAGNPNYRELSEALDALSDAERSEVLALTWLGRGDYDAAEWQQALDDARHCGNEKLLEYVTGEPCLCDCLKEGLMQLGYQIGHYEIGRF